MNYRHAFHAGNHADVLKHVVLCRIVEHLKKKEKPFRIIDAHAGVGIYALDGPEAFKTLEWQGGIGRMVEPFQPNVEALLKPYRQSLDSLNPAGPLSRYPGSPWLAAHLMRASDRLIANEFHPDDRRLLEGCFRHDSRVTVTGLDALAVIKAKLPPLERRGVILIDPPYEENDEVARALSMLAEGLKRFDGGCFVLWYPVKADNTAARISKNVHALGHAGTLKVEMRVREAFKAGGLAGSGMMIVNPPWKLDEELALLVPALAERLGLGKWGQGRVTWLLPPT